MKSFEGQDVGLIARFSVEEPIVVKCDISYVDLDGDRKNLKAECKGFDIDDMDGKAFVEWEKAFLTYGEITTGGVLKYELSAEPCKERDWEIPSVMLYNLSEF